MTRPILEIDELTAHHGRVQALSGIDMGVAEGEIVAITGANGAGKTTLLRSLAGELANEPGMIRLRDRPIGALPPEKVPALGIVLMTAGRRLFPSLGTEENLLVGARPGHWTLESVYRLFPTLRERRRVPVLALSAAQRQRAALGRALMANPQILLCDEIGAGVPEVVVRDLYAVLARVRDAGASVIVAEPDIDRALRVADRIYCLTEGRVTMVGRPADLSRTDLLEAYRGVGA